ncbi:MAG TPA: MFS transporter [Burkholderiaceae bacterium]
MSTSATAGPPVAKTPFTGYQKFVVGLLAFLQFAVILDFMLMSPLGAIIMPALHISTKQFGLVVSAYAFSAGAAGLLTAGFADRFDRKRLLLFFYGGFIVGTVWCGRATSFESLLAARVVTGLFGGVIGSVVLAIATDLFPPQMRGRVMGVIQTAFAASQVLGLPTALYLSSRWDWHVPFLVLAGIGVLAGAVVALRMKPVDTHLGRPQEHSPFVHLWHTLTDGHHALAFAAVALLTTGGFMLMPFSSAFLVDNLQIGLVHLPTIYLATGLCTIFFGPVIGRLADAVGKIRVFLFGSALSIVMVVVYTRLGPIPLWSVIVVNVVLFIGIFSRMIPFQAMVAGVPEPARRGAFNAISASIQQLAGGVASVVAGHLVSIGADGRLAGFDVVGDVVVGCSVTAAALGWAISRALRQRVAH